MKCNMFLSKRLLLIVINFLPYFAMAQDPGPCPDCPIDGGLSFLLVAGAGYGLMKYLGRKKLNAEIV